jgi:GNAT superfamily N-acetyltransferase
MAGMEARPVTKRDFDHIAEVIDSWWGGASRQIADPMFFYELGDMARVVVEDEQMIGFVFAFITPQAPPVGFIHLVGVHPAHRRHGVGKFIYAWFEQACRDRGVERVKAITTLGNEGSVLFHQGIGWDFELVNDYAGPGRARIVFSKKL